jgi:hypothetical protein
VGPRTISKISECGEADARWSFPIKEFRHLYRILVSIRKIMVVVEIDTHPASSASRPDSLEVTFSP